MVVTSFSYLESYTCFSKKKAKKKHPGGAITDPRSRAHALVLCTSRLEERAQRVVIVRVRVRARVCVCSNAFLRRAHQHANEKERRA